MILVVGGAGSIGSHVVNRFVQTERVVVYDNLSTGCREAVNDQAIFIEGELADEKRLTQVFSLFPIETVVHLAATSQDTESNNNPHLFYETNVAATLLLLKVMRAYNVKSIIYSSTTFANTSIEETNNPYARSQYFVEQILQDYTKAYKMNCIVLRNLNVLDTHLEGIVNAYSLALEMIEKNEQPFEIYNLGIGQAFSVNETYEGISNEKEHFKISDSRLEGQPLFISSLKKIQQELGLYAEKNLQQMISDAWNGHQHKNLNF